MSNIQPGILAPVPGVARYMFFALEPGSDPGQALRSLRGLADGYQSYFWCPPLKNERLDLSALSL